MKIFGLGMPELVLILVVVLIIFGPKNLPKLGAMLGRSVKKLRERSDKDFSDDEDEETPANDEDELQTSQPKKKKRVIKKVVKKLPPAEDDASS